MFKIEELPKQHIPNADWIAWLKSDDGYSVKVQISGRATIERASEIVHQFAGIVNQ